MAAILGPTRKHNATNLSAASQKTQLNCTARQTAETAHLGKPGVSPKTADYRFAHPLRNKK
jgi:hypothetical protein